MNTWSQLALVFCISCAAALATYRISGPPDRRVPCDARQLEHPDEICLDRVMGEWRGAVLWVDARSRAEWRRDGVPGSLLFNINPAEDMVDLMEASRGYEANVAAISAVKDMIHSSIDLAR